MFVDALTLGFSCSFCSTIKLPSWEDNMLTFSGNVHGDILSGFTRSSL